MNIAHNPQQTKLPALPERWELLFAAVVSDALDEFGIANQVMEPTIRPLDDDLMLCARARTGVYMEVPYVTEGENPYELEIKLIDDLCPGEVAVFACGGSKRIAPWGGLLSTATKSRGASGCVTDGFVRDIKEIRRLKLPVFAGGIAPLDSKGRGQIMTIDVPVICAGVRVCPGDLVIGDADGLVVIPQQHEAKVLEKAFEKIDDENRSIKELRAGGYLRDVYAKYGVL
ncbi:MAG: RraA family protein [Rhizobiales bacterium]|nr:RraA family protein [Hyphomicrobiales bacterium]NRB15837.1 RraA family protein [Hyphomicrobiales bacterium]